MNNLTDSNASGPLAGPRDIRIADFDYPLPDDRIAKHPLADRDQCLLLVSGRDGSLGDRRFSQLPDLLGPRGMTVMNNTRVIHARMHFRRPTGASIEVFLLDPLSPSDHQLAFQTDRRCEWGCMVGNLKKWKEPTLEREVELPDGRIVRLRATLLEPCGGNARRVAFEWDDPQVTFATIVENAGRIPIPPYLNRDSEEADEEDYQTVYSKEKGSVAAPTAGLHFTPALLEELRSRGQRLREVTLHVGAGTFQPVKSDSIGGHPMHTETFRLPSQLLRELADSVERRLGGEEWPLTAVGTTTVRTLESLPYLGRRLGRELEAGRPAPEMHLGQWEAYEEPMEPEMVAPSLRLLADWADKEMGGTLHASTAIMIAPGFRWNIVTRMVTNFHQPSSTLLLLVSSFLGDGGQWRKIYRHALDGDYRFLSYGDACLLEPIG